MSEVTERLSSALADRYRIERHLGAGGMANVYLAYDVKHDRKVALKVLKPELAAVLGAERFVVEIKTTAALQHPHILPLFDSGTADGFLYYVMPFIDGETLRDKLNRETQFGIDEAVHIAIDVAGALDYAHRHGVIHRDIKPENILLHDGRPMVADFGIALAVSAAAGGRMTETGLSLGTPHYMSPEQATAEKEITARADVYSLASVLYEMLAGDPPHTGSSAQQIIMKIIADPARPVTQLRKSVPAHVAAAVAHGLEKLPADRFQSAKAFADALADPSYTLAGTAARAAGLTVDARWRTRFVAASVVAGVLLAAAAVGWGREWARPSPAPARLDLSLGAVVPTAQEDVVISPDGTMLLVAGTLNGDRAIYMRRLDGDAEFRKVPGTETGEDPCFSPDSRWIVFNRTSDRTLVKVSVLGGGAITLVPTGPIYPAEPHWGTDDMIVFTGPTGAFRIPAAGGTPVKLSTGIGTTPFLLPDGSGVLTSVRGVGFYDFRTDSIAPLVPGGRNPVYVEPGQLLYSAEDGGLFVVPFDLGRHAITGPPVRVLERVASTTFTRGYSVSRTGVLVHHEGRSIGGSVAGNTRLIVKTMGGATDTLRLPQAFRTAPNFSPDGRSIAYETGTPGATQESAIYTFNLVTGTNTQLTFGGESRRPIWSPDGKRIAFAKRSAATDMDVWVKPADNSGPERPLLTLPGIQYPSGWLDDSTVLFHSSTQAVAQFDLFTWSPADGTKPRVYLDAPWSEYDLQVSRDHSLAAFTSTETGSQEVWIRDFPVATGKWRVSATGGAAPRWSPDGRLLYFWHAGTPDDSLFRVRVDRTPAVALHAPELVLTIDVAGIANWSLHPDGKRFIIPVREEDAPVGGTAGKPDVSRYLVVLNWFSELKATVRKGSR